MFDHGFPKGKEIENEITISFLKMEKGKYVYRIKVNESSAIFFKHKKKYLLDTLPDIIKGVIPFIAIIAFCLIIFSIFPQLITWLPSLMMK